MVDLFLGEPYDYWISLKKRLEEKGLDSMQVDHLFKDLIAANAKVTYYELQIRRMNEYREAVNK